MIHYSKTDNMPNKRPELRAYTPGMKLYSVDPDGKLTTFRFMCFEGEAFNTKIFTYAYIAEQSTRNAKRIHYIALNKMFDNELDAVILSRDKMLESVIDLDKRIHQLKTEKQNESKTESNESESSTNILRNHFRQ